MKKIILVLLLSLVLVLTGCSKVKYDWDSKKIVVGLEAAYAPFNWLETEATATNHKLDGMNAYVEGYDVQMAKLIAKDMGVDLVIKMVDWDGLIVSLESGMIDLIIAGMSPTEDRLKTINFTNSYYESEHVVVVSKTGAFKDATDINDFKNAKIIGQKGTLYDTIAAEIATLGKGIHATPLATIPEIVNSLNTGVNDVTVVEKPVAISIVTNNPNLKYIKLTTPFTLEESDTIVSIGLRKIDNDLKDAINESLSRISLETREALMLNASTQAPGE